MPPIENYDVYTSGMEKSMEDKLFWLNRIPKKEYSVVIDYGCADGTFLKKVREHNPDCFLYGIDIDDLMLEKAKEKVGRNAVFVHESMLGTPAQLNGDVINLSSVLHEIYSYKTEKEICNFLDYINGHKYICIRDMCIDDVKTNNMYVPELMYKDDAEKTRRLEFEEIWGPITEPKNFVHYMLKYRYVENWKREVKENYLPISYKRFNALARILGYDIVYERHYTLPFLKEKILEDWGYEITIPTHIQMIWKRKES